MKKNRNYFIYIIPAFFGFITYGPVGLIGSPFAFWYISKLAKNRFNYFFENSGSVWAWFILGFFLVLIKPNYNLGPVRNLMGETMDITTSEMKYQLLNGVRECEVRKSNGLSTNFLDVYSFRKEHPIFKIKEYKNSKYEKTCFSAIAKQYRKNFINLIEPYFIRKLPTYPIFKVEYNSETGYISKTCNDLSSVDGCKEGNNW